MNNILEIFLSFGIGGIVASLVSISLQYYYNEKVKRKTLAFEEKKEAFIGLLGAYRDIAISSSIESNKNFGYWHMRCQLIGSSKLNNAIKGIIDSNDNEQLRLQAHNELLKEMGRELKGFYSK